MPQLPKQIRDQIDEAERIGDAIKQENAPEVSKKDEIDALLSEVEGGDPKQATEAPVTPQVTEPQVTPEPKAKPERTDYKTKYSVLQGKYDAEVPRLHDQVKSLNKQVEEMTRALADRKPQPESAPTQKPSQYVSPEDVEEYGSDFIDLVGRKAQEIADAKMGEVTQTLHAEIKELKDQLAATGSEIKSSKVDRMFAKLDQEVENWREINENQDFLAWLSQTDPFTGSRRQDLLLQAFEAGDSRRVKAFFEGFSTEHATVNVSPDSTVAPVPDQPAAPTLNVEDYVAPGQSKTGQHSAPQNKRVWTQAQIQGFYSDVQKGAFKGREADKRRIEMDISLAGREGRVR